MEAVPEAEGRKLVVQDDVVAVAGASWHGLDEPNDPVAEPVLVNATVPAGDVGLLALVSVTVAVQTDAWLTTTGESQETVVVVECAAGGLTKMLAALVVELPL